MKLRKFYLKYFFETFLTRVIEPYINDKQMRNFNKWCDDISFPHIDINRNFKNNLIKF